MATTIRITPTRVIFNAGKFDSDFRYIRRTAQGARSTMLAGPSIAVALDPTGWRISWRFQCGAFSARGNGGGSVTPPASVPNTPALIAL